MKYVEHTFSTPQENLACDEALLDFSEEGGNLEVIRFWESPTYFVVLGSSNKVEMEVDVAACVENGVPVFRRRSGGGAVVQGPGCLSFCLILGINPSCSTISSTNRLVLNKHSKAVGSTTGREVLVRGTSDLALGQLKFSGNSQRRRLRYLLFHGTFLLNFDISAIERFLRFPSRQPDYRKSRPHKAFLTNLDAPASDLKSALKASWRAHEPMTNLPEDRISRLASERYGSRDWNFRM